MAWDYTPSGYNVISGQPFGDSENVFIGQSDTTIGKVYLKALYREYTDATFTTLKTRGPEWEHLGTLGPLIRASVGDTIVVIFKNNARYPFSIHPHGVFYAKDSEGAPYNDGTTDADRGDDAVPPGGLNTYRWSAPARAGPGPMDGSSVLWMYHSHVDEPADTNGGLIGPMIITRANDARPDASPRSVDREFITMFTVFDENSSPYLESNIDNYIGRPQIVDREDEDFVESNLMHSINGYVYGNQPGLTMRKGERVRWYTLGMGTEVDLHTPHWHGNTVVVMGTRADIVELLPASMKVADMETDAAGTWLYHCHVNDHIHAGMLSLYTVEP